MVYWIDKLKHKFYTTYMKHKYPDFEDNEYNIGSIKFIWGVTSWDDMTSYSTANLYTMNDIDIVYDRDTGLYLLGIETAYLFENKYAEIKYLDNLLNKFTQFMVDNNFNIDCEYMLFMSGPEARCSAESIPELYIQFRIFVEGYKAIYGKEENNG